MSWWDSLQGVVRRALPDTRHDLVDATTEAVAAAAGHGDRHALSWKPVFNSPSPPGLSDYRTHFVVEPERVRHCANLIRLGRSRSDLLAATHVLRGLITRNGLDVGVDAMDAALDAYLAPPPAAGRAGTPADDPDMATALLLAYVDPTVVHVLLDRFAPGMERILIASSGLDIMRAIGADLRTASDGQVARAESWFMSVARSVNPRLDLAGVRTMLDDIQADRRGGVGERRRGEVVGAYGAGLMDEAGAFGQFDVMHALRHGFDMMSDGADRVIGRWIGPTPVRGAERLQGAREAGPDDMPAAVDSAVRGNADDFFGELDRDDLARDGLVLRGALSEDFGADRAFTPGRNAFMDAAEAAGVNLDHARARLGKYGGAGYRMQGDEGAYPVPTSAELKWRRVGNASRFVGRLAWATANYARNLMELVTAPNPVDLVKDTRDYFNELREAAEIGREEIAEVARDQRRRDLLDTQDAPRPQVRPPEPPPVEPPPPEPQPAILRNNEADPKPPAGNEPPPPANTPPPAPTPTPGNELAGTIGIRGVVVCTLDPEFAGGQGGGTVPVEVAVEAIRARYLSDINFLPAEIAGRDLRWMTPAQLEQKVAMAILPWIYPPRPGWSELHGRGAGGSPNRQNENVSDPPRPAPR